MENERLEEWAWRQKRVEHLHKKLGFAANNKSSPRFVAAQVPYEPDKAPEECFEKWAEMTSFFK